MTTEPSDIVESTPENLPDRLMAYHEMGKQKPHVLMMAPLVEAAAEITRLRAALAQRTEECARVAEEYAREARGHTEEESAAENIAAAIRAMKS